MVLLVKQHHKRYAAHVSEKLRYEIDLSNTVPIPALDVGLQIRTVSPTDLVGLAKLILDAYVGTTSPRTGMKESSSI